MHIRERALGPVICATTCIGLFLVAEIALWGYGYDTFGIYLRPDELAIRRIANIDDPMAYELTPGFSGNGFATKFTINRAGFRGPWPRREAAATVLFLGDSVAFGYGLQDSETVAAQLERILNTKGESVQVLNFGVPGYDVLDVVRTLKQKGPAFEPDLVIILYCLNDVGVVSSQLNRLTSLEGRRRNPLLRSRLIQFVTRKLDRVQDQSLSQRMNKPLTFREAFADQIEPVFDHERELASLMKRAGEGPHPTAWYGDVEKVGRLRFAMNELAAVAEADGVPILVAVVPRLEGSSANYAHATAHEIVAGEVRRAGLDLLDLAKPMLAADIEGLRLEPIHPNQLGARFIARELNEYLHDTGLLPRTRE